MTSPNGVPHANPSTTVGAPTLSAVGAPTMMTVESLTPRQEQILVLIGEGMTNREIGARLGVTEKTIKNSVTGLLACLNVQRRSQAAVYATVRRVTAEMNSRDGAERASQRLYR
jgi:two-component system response regulator DevR